MNIKLNDVQFYFKTVILFFWKIKRFYNKLCCFCLSGNYSPIIVHGGQMGPLPGSVSNPFQARSGNY